MCCFFLIYFGTKELDMHNIPPQYMTSTAFVKTQKMVQLQRDISVCNCTANFVRVTQHIQQRKNSAHCQHASLTAFCLSQTTCLYTNIITVYFLHKCVLTFNFHGCVLVSPLTPYKFLQSGFTKITAFVDCIPRTGRGYTLLS